MIGGANLFGGSSVTLWNDRFGRNQSALDLNSGYIQAPPGVYFAGDFTVTFWTFVRQKIEWSRVLDFGNGQGVDNVVICLCYGNQPAIGADIFFGTSYIQRGFSGVNYEFNKWYFITFVLIETTLSIYYNGSKTGNTSFSNVAPRNILRSSNYVGKSNWNNDAAHPNAKFDDLKFFNRALDQTEILKEMGSDL